MECFDRHSGLTKTVALVLAAIPSSGCLRYQAVEGSYVTARSPDHVRVTLTDGRTEHVWYPAVAGNLLTGSQPSGDHLLPVRLPLSQVRSIEVPHTDVGRTVLLVTGVSLVALVAIAAATFQGMKGSYSGFGSF